MRDIQPVVLKNSEWENRKSHSKMFFFLHFRPIRFQYKQQYCRDWKKHFFYFYKRIVERGLDERKRWSSSSDLSSPNLIHCSYSLNKRSPGYEVHSFRREVAPECTLNWLLSVEKNQQTEFKFFICISIRTETEKLKMFWIIFQWEERRLQIIYLSFYSNSFERIVL